MNVRLAPDAEEHAEVCDSWGRENRPAARDLFAQELAATKVLLASTPKIGLVYAVVRGQAVRKLLMPRTRHHVYYSVDPEAGDVVIYAIWGAPKEHGPKL